MNPAQFAADLDAATVELRAFAEARMTSRVAVMRLTGDMTTDAEGFDIPEWAAVHVDLPFRLVGGASRKVTIGGLVFEEATARGDMPAATEDLADEDYIEITSGEWVGSTYRVVEAIKGDQRTARRIPIAEVARPEEWS